MDFIGSLFDLCWISIGPLLDLYWISIGSLVDFYWMSYGSLLESDDASLIFTSERTMNTNAKRPKTSLKLLEVLITQSENGAGGSCPAGLKN